MLDAGFKRQKEKLNRLIAHVSRIGNANTNLTDRMGVLEAEAGRSRQPLRGSGGHLPLSSRTAPQRYRRDPSLIRGSKPFAGDLASTNSPEEQAFIDAVIAKNEGCTSELAGFSSSDSLHNYPSFQRRPPVGIVLLLTDVVVGNSSEGLHNDLSELRFMSSAQYKVEKLKDHDHLRDRVDFARRFRVTEVKRQADQWQRLERGRRMDHYRSRAYIKELEAYVSVYIRFFEALEKYYRDLKDAPDAWEVEKYSAIRWR